MPSQFKRREWSALTETIGKRFLDKTRDEWAALFSGTDACVFPVLDVFEVLRLYGPMHMHRFTRFLVASCLAPFQPNQA